MHDAVQAHGDMRRKSTIKELQCIGEKQKENEKQSSSNASVRLTEQVKRSVTCILNLVEF